MKEKASDQTHKTHLQKWIDQNRTHIYSYKSHANQQFKDIFLYSERGTTGMTKHAMLAKPLIFQIHTDIKFWQVLLKISHGTSTTRRWSAI
jgi:hypothetical protein